MAGAAAYNSMKAAALKAVSLYQKANVYSRAMELCFAMRLFEPLQKIVEETVFS